MSKKSNKKSKKLPKFPNRFVIAVALGVDKDSILRVDATNRGGECGPDDKFYISNLDNGAAVYCLTDGNDEPPHYRLWGWEPVDCKKRVKGWKYKVWTMDDSPEVKDDTEGEDMQVTAWEKIATDEEPASHLGLPPESFDGPPREVTEGGITLPPDAEAWREMIEAAKLPSLAEPFAYYAMQQMVNATDPEGLEPDMVVFDDREVKALMNAFEDFTRLDDVTPDNIEWHQKRIDLAKLTCDVYKIKAESRV